MKPEQFFNIFLEELKNNPSLTTYYKFLVEDGRFNYRKSYFLRRLKYIYSQMPEKNEETIWDCGCGYGTTAIFLSLNGYKIHGSTLEFYYEQIPGRLEFWSRYGDINFTYDYKNIFDEPPLPGSYSNIILQDTLHHLEPINDALKLFYNALKPGGKIIAVEENGKNPFINIILFLRRGLKFTTKIYDERLDKYILIGNENVRSFNRWAALFRENNFVVDPSTVQFIRFYPPFIYAKNSAAEMDLKEETIWKKSKFLRNNFFWGVNFSPKKL
jgi:SAM-dependent methyltransferase